MRRDGWALYALIIIFMLAGALVLGWALGWISGLRNFASFIADIAIAAALIIPIVMSLRGVRQIRRPGARTACFVLWIISIILIIIFYVLLRTRTVFGRW